MMYQSKNEKFEVDAGPAGAMQFQSGDWLSRFSAAIYGNRWTAKEPPVTNIGFSAAETIIGTAATLKSEQEERQFILAHLKAKHKLAREHAEFIGKLCQRVHRTSEFADIAQSLAQLLPKGLVEVLPNTLLDVLQATSEWRTVELFSTVGAVLFSAASAIQMVNDWETGQRLIGLRGVAYGVTSWAFEEPAPPPPAWIGANLPPSSAHSSAPAEAQASGICGYVAKAKAREEDEAELGLKAWNAGCKSAWREMQDKADRAKANKAKVRTMWRKLAGGEPQQLARIIMGNLEKRHLDEGAPYIRAAFWSPAPNYPEA